MSAIQSLLGQTGRRDKAKMERMTRSGLSHRLLVSFNVPNDALILNVCNKFFRAGQKPAKQRRAICLVVAESEIDGWRIALERSSNNVWRQHILRIERNESHSALDATSDMADDMFSPSYFALSTIPSFDAHS